MYFFIEYNRDTKELIKFIPYENQTEAWNIRFDRELELFKTNQMHIEVVVFQADTEEILKRNHSRYFKDILYFKKALKNFVNNKSSITKGINDLESRLEQLAL